MKLASFALALLTLLALACAFTTGKTAPTTAFPVGARGGRMLSSDGVLLATVPAASGAPATLTVQPVDVAGLKSSFGGHEVLAAYELGPDGSTFSPPVEVELDLGLFPAIARDEMPLLWASEGGGFEPVARQEIADGGPDGRFVVRGKLPHFSTVVLTRGANLRLTFTVPDFVTVGQQFTPTGRMVANANSSGQALSLTMRATGYNALSGARGARDFGAIDGGAQTVDRNYDPVTCARAGYGFFIVVAEFTGYTNIRNGQRTRPTTVTRTGETRTFCHQPSGTDSRGGPGTAGNQPLQSLAVTPTSVDKLVGESFVLEATISGRTGDQGIAFYDVFPGTLSAGRPANPRTAGNVTAVRDFDAAGANFTLGGTGGVRMEYRCERAGETGIEMHTTYSPPLDVSTRVTCRQPPGEEQPPREEQPPPEQPPPGDEEGR